jgi:BirA family biotin operon repressor/biotin-[acetyl-CoA-carboxylase] ligase
MPDGAPPWRLLHVAIVASTQDVAIDAARRGEVARFAISAGVQTAGRGSRGRGWTAPPGNLNLSVLLRPSGPPDPGHWSLLAGVALFEALSPYAGGGLMLKWPNDILLNGGKLGGILIDSTLDDKRRVEWLVIGVGANLRESPRIAGQSTACLPPPAPDARTVVNAFLASLDRWADTDIRAAWLARAHAPGTIIDMVTRDRRIRGRFAGLSAQGELLLENHPPINSAEIFLPQQAARPRVVPCSSS